MPQLRVCHQRASAASRPSAGLRAKSQLAIASRVAARLGSDYLNRMGSPRSKGVSIACVVFALAIGPASAQPKKERVERPLEFAPSVPSIMVDVDENGTPLIAKDSQARPKKPEAEDRQSKRAERPRRTPRGSSTYVEPTPLPNTARSSGIVAPPPVTTYNPPPINNPSERIGQFNHSFPLNGGLGNNPTDRDAYIRYNLNR
jgi:hypothetical protein